MNQTNSQTWFELLSSEGMDWYALITNQPLPSQNVGGGTITVDPSRGSVAVGGGVGMLLLVAIAAYFLLKD